MSTSLRAALIAGALLAGCGGREADLVIAIERGSHSGRVEVYVCREADTTTPCKHVVPLDTGDGRQKAEVGVFINDGTERLDINLQLGTPTNKCAHFTVAVGDDPQVEVQLDGAASVPFTLPDCDSCSAPDTTCTWR